MRAYFDDVPGVGSLKLDYVLYYDNEPSQFILRDANNSLYFAILGHIDEMKIYVLCPISFESLLKLVEGTTNFMELFKDSEDRLLYIRKIRGLLPFLFQKNNVRLSEVSLPAIRSSWMSDSLEMEAFKKHYQSDINHLKNN